MLEIVVFIFSVLAVSVVSEKALGQVDTDILNTLGGPDYVIVVIFTAAVFFILVILVKRQLLRILLISKRGAHTAIGSGAPKRLAHEIEASIRRVERLKIEPRTLADNLQKPNREHLQFQSQHESVNDLESLRYRFKAMDIMTYLDDLLCRVDVRFCRKSHETVRDHLKSLQNPPRAPLAGMETVCESVVKLYEDARYGKKEFGEQEYKQLFSHIEGLKTSLRQKVAIPGTLVSSDTAGSSNEVTAGAARQPKKGAEKTTTVVYRSSAKSGEAIRV